MFLIIILPILYNILFLIPNIPEVVSLVHHPDICKKKTL